MHTLWVKIFLFSKNIDFSTKKFSNEPPLQAKIFLFAAYDNPLTPLASLKESKFLSCTHPEIKIFYSQKSENFPKTSSKKFLPPFHCKLKFFCLLHMIAHSLSYNAPRNKNFVMQWSWVKNFLLTQNTNFESKKF